MLPKPQPQLRKIRLMLVDDEPSVRKGLRLLLGLEPDLEICGEAGSESQALERIPALKPDLAVVDLSLKKGSGFALIKQLRQRYPGVKILVFSMYEQSHFVAAAFAAGVHGYVTKAEGSERVLEAIRLVMDGKFYLSEELCSKAPNLLPVPGLRHTQRHD